MKYFTEEELAQESRSLPDLALEALRGGELEHLLVLLNRMSVAHRGLANLGLQWIGRMLGKVRSDFGEAFLDTLLGKSAAFLMEPYAREFLQGKEKEVLSELILMFRMQIGAEIVPSDETDNQVVFSLSPCGSGGRLILEGWPETLPELYAPCSDGTPIYCRMCKHLQQGLNEACGATVWTTRINDTVPGACEMRFFKQETAGQRLFEPEEIYAVSEPRCRQALEKVLAGDLAVEELIKDQHLEWKPWHDLFVQLATCILSAVYKEKGAEYLDEFLKETYDTSFGSIYSMYQLLDDVAMFRMMVQTWHYHIARFTVVEEDDRFVFILDPCGSGGRLYRSEMHKKQFRYGTDMACLMEEPANINFNRKDFPIYCTHCASTNRDQFEGNPFVFVIDGHAQKDPNAPCIHYLYKKGAKREVAREILAQVGKSTLDPA
jgi:hypothetical protein